MKTDSGYLSREEIDYEFRGIDGACVARNAIYWDNKANDPTASAKDKAFARKQFEAAVPSSLDELRQMASRYYPGY